MGARMAAASAVSTGADEKGAAAVIGLVGTHQRETELLGSLHSPMVKRVSANLVMTAEGVVAAEAVPHLGATGA